MKTIGIIPSRYASMRFPGKPLADLGGKSMIRRVYEQATKASSLDEVIVATDDERIVENVESFGGRVLMTRPDHRSGTDRCAEVIALLGDASIAVNIQGDEPFLDPGQIDQVVRLLGEEKSGISTLARPLLHTEELFNANVVKVVMDHHQKALYFSRSPIPYLRHFPQVEWVKQAPYFKHIGLYAFRCEVLRELTELEPSRYERAEALEQLRWLEAGHSIFVGLTETETIGVDTPADLERARAYLQKEGV
jgi:3-deoxy-manno-octulosonate cytidylyltransferase (CMP-KDO synthetase)